MPKAKARGAHRKRRERSPLPGLMIHQDGSSHEWVAGQRWDLIVTLDEATSEHYAMHFVEEEGTQSSFLGVREVIEARGLFCSFYSDRGSHYWHTPEAGGKVDKKHLTQFGQAMRRLGIEMIPAYSPEARGRSERMFRTHQERLPRELALAGITDRVSANRYLAESYRPAFNAEFMQPAMEEGSAFVAWIGGHPVRAIRAPGGIGQLREFRGESPPDSRRPPPLPLRESQGRRAAPDRRASGHLPRPAQAGRV